MTPLWKSFPNTVRPKSHCPYIMGIWQHVTKVASIQVKYQVSRLAQPHCTEVLIAFVSDFFWEIVWFNSCSVLGFVAFYVNFLKCDSDYNLCFKFKISLWCCFYRYICIFWWSLLTSVSRLHFVFSMFLKVILTFSRNQQEKFVFWSIYLRFHFTKVWNTFFL